MLWKTPSNMWRSISPVTCTGNQGKVTPSQPGCQHISGETGGLPSSCGPTTPMQRVECFWRLLPELFLRTHGIKASAWTHGFVLPEIFFFPVLYPLLVLKLFLYRQTISDTSRKKKYCRFELDLFFIAAVTSCVCCTICWPQPLPCWATSAHQLPQRASVLLEWNRLQQDFHISFATKEKFPLPF